MTLKILALFFLVLIHTVLGNLVLNNYNVNLLTII